VPVTREPTRPLGVVYTPREVATAMVQLALAPWLRDRTRDQLSALRICDFAVGEGVFLEEAITAIGGAASTAAGCVAGVDIDRDALAIAQRRLDCPRDALRAGNALELDWAAAFPDVFAGGGFDVVVGNPPYIRQESLAGKHALHSFETYDGVADLYIYFFELAHRLLRPGGRYCLITPNKWLTVEYGRKLRRFLAARGSVEGVVDLGRMPLFADADAFPCIVWGTVGAASSHPVLANRATTGDVATALRTTISIPRPSLGDGPWHLDAPAERALIDRLEKRWPRLDALLPGKPCRGVVTGCNRAFVIDRETRDRLLADPTSAPLIRPFVRGRDVRRFRAATPERWILLVDRGTPIENHPAIAAHLAQFRDALEPRPLDHAGPWRGRKPGTYRWYELQDPVGELAASQLPRLLYQDIQTGPACALDDGERVPDTTVWMLPTADRCVLAILNSSLYGWYARRRFPPALNGAVRPKLAYISALPIATPDAQQRAALEALVDDASPERDAELDRQIFDLYELSVAERALVTT
jgi:SAM-dependent methyltransferase